VEPYRSTTLEVEGADSTNTYAWSFSDGSVATGSSVTYTFGTVGATTFDLLVTDDDGNTVSKTTHQVRHLVRDGGSEGVVWLGGSDTARPAGGQVLARYVRREVRSLSSDDLTSLIAAVKEVRRAYTSESFASAW
jgi:PKD repeat protein